MKTVLFAILISVAGTGLLVRAAAPEFTSVNDWLTLADGRPSLGNMHGDIAVSANGEVYVSVQDPQAGLQVYAPDGRLLRTVPGRAGRPARLHHQPPARRRVHQ